MINFFLYPNLKIPKNNEINDAIWVVIDRLTKSILFIPMKMIDLVDKLSKLYIYDVIRLYGVPWCQLF
jgi:hypothetical protein